MKRNILHTRSRINVPGEPLDRRAWLRWAGVAGLLPAGCARRAQVTSSDDATLIRFPRLRAWMEMPKHRFLELQRQFPSVLQDR